MGSACALGAHVALPLAHRWGPKRASHHCADMDTGGVRRSSLQSPGPGDRQVEGQGGGGKAGLRVHSSHSEDYRFYSEPAVLSRDGTKPNMF